MMMGSVLEVLFCMFFFSAQELPDTVLFGQYGTRGCPNLEMSITEKHLSCV